uniref:Uncharacterized protein n=1 Tax=Odontella aurita TaxID=265563 RepID=A0A7S4IXK7_9STRA
MERECIRMQRRMQRRPGQSGGGRRRCEGDDDDAAMTTMMMMMIQLRGTPPAQSTSVPSSGHAIKCGDYVEYQKLAILRACFIAPWSAYTTTAACLPASRRTVGRGRAGEAPYHFSHRMLVHERIVPYHTRIDF